MVTTMLIITTEDIACALVKAANYENTLVLPQQHASQKFSVFNSPAVPQSMIS